MRPSVVAGGTANLYTVMPQNEIVMLTVIDVAGRQLWSQFMSLGKGEYYTPMSVSRLSKGMYYMKVTSNDGISTVLSFIKN